MGIWRGAYNGCHTWAVNAGFYNLRIGPFEDEPSEPSWSIEIFSEEDANAPSSHDVWPRSSSRKKTSAIIELPGS